jgi:mercuric ion transport protein
MTDHPTALHESRIAIDATVSPARTRRGWVAAMIAFLTCPCHLPLVLIALSGAAAGGALAAHRGLVSAVLVVLFLTSATTAWRLFTAPNRAPHPRNAPPTTTSIDRNP